MNPSMDALGSENAVLVEPSETDAVKPVRLSLHLIVKRHLPNDADSWSHDKVIEALNKITHLRLDRENIGEIDGLELLGSKLTNVYLQQNRIKHIQNLDCLHNIQCLTLAGNGIGAVENLRHLSRLIFLDLSDNSIADVDTAELPQSLIILNLEGNPCCDKPGHRQRIIMDLPKLKQLNGTEISKQEKLEAGFPVSSDESGDEEEDEEEEEEPFNQERSMPSLRTLRPKLPDIEVHLKDVANEMLLRSQNRVEEMLQMHQRHRMEMDNLRLQDKTLAKRLQDSAQSSQNF